MDAAAREYLKSNFGFTDEEIDQKFTADRATKFEVEYKTFNDVRARQTEIDAAQAALKTANDKLNAEIAEWAGLTERERKERTDLQASLEQARVRATQLETRLTTLAQEHGVDPKALLEGTAVIPEKKPEPKAPDFDPKQYVRSDQLGPIVSFAFDLPATLEHIRDEHFALTGERLDTRPIIAEVKARAAKNDANIDPVAIWETKYDIGAKRDAKAKAEAEARDKAAEDRGYQRAMTERAVPGATPAARHAIVFGQRNGQGEMTPRTSRLNRPQPESSVRAAAQALATHKYRQAGQ